MSTICYHLFPPVCCDCKLSFQPKYDDIYKHLRHYFIFEGSIQCGTSRGSDSAMSLESDYVSVEFCDSDSDHESTPFCVLPSHPPELIEETTKSLLATSPFQLALRFLERFPRSCQIKLMPSEPNRVPVTREMEYADIESHIQMSLEV